MNYIWGLMMLISVLTSVITGRVDETVNAVFEGAQSAVSTLISLAGVMCFWTGVMKIAEKSGISDFVCRLVSPLARILFPGSGEIARRYITMNITANMLGMGNAATPMGMLAAEELDRENSNPAVPSVNMCMLVVLNTTSFQLVPSTIIALRAAAGSLDAVSIILPIWFASLCAAFAGVCSVKIMGRLCG
jgi:spore maturation protein A